LLGFLRTEVVGSSITKISREKFAVKAEVYPKRGAGGLSCTVKARVYQEGGNTYAVEFQRRCGDGVTFYAVYQQAVRYFEPLFRLLSEPAETAYPTMSVAPAARHARNLLASPPPPPITPLTEANAAGDEASEFAGPLLDMALCNERRDLQAEAATNLARIIEGDGRLAAELCAERAFQGFKALLEAPENRILQPTAQLLTTLAESPEGAERCADNEELLRLTLEKINSPQTVEGMIRRQLTQFLNTMVAQCSARVSDKIPGEIRRALVEVMSRQGVEATDPAFEDLHAECTAAPKLGNSFAKAPPAPPQLRCLGAGGSVAARMTPHPSAAAVQRGGVRSRAAAHQQSAESDVVQFRDLTSVDSCLSVLQHPFAGAQ
jgi:hypothetical protein